MKSKYYCQKCGNEKKSSKGILCRSCAGKDRSIAMTGKRGLQTSRYIDGRTSNKYLCTNCNKEISMTSGYYNNSLCQSCAHKNKKLSIEHKNNIKKATTGKNNPFFGRKHTLETKKLLSKLNLREKHPQWRGGSSCEIYPIEWTRVYKSEIRKRDDYICQWCGKLETENNKKLSVHHIDYNKNNCDEDNLISLCATCHQKTNFNRAYWIKKFTSKRSLRYELSYN